MPYYYDYYEWHPNDAVPALPTQQHEALSILRAETITARHTCGTCYVITNAKTGMVIEASDDSAKARYHAARGR